MASKFDQDIVGCTVPGQCDGNLGICRVAANVCERNRCRHTNGVHRTVTVDPQGPRTKQRFERSNSRAVRAFIRVGIGVARNWNVDEVGPGLCSER